MLHRSNNHSLLIYMAFVNRDPNRQGLECCIAATPPHPRQGAKPLKTGLFRRFSKFHFRVFFPVDRGTVHRSPRHRYFYGIFRWLPKTCRNFFALGATTATQ